MKRTNRVGSGRPFIIAPFLLHQEGQALIGLYQRAAFCVKQESGFMFSAFFLTNDTGAGQTIITSLRLEGVDGNESSLQAA